eukprot:SM000487S16646  [mRNA]  locus=s487:146:2424:+ [translate_table: standard]
MQLVSSFRGFYSVSSPQPGVDRHLADCVKSQSSGGVVQPAQVTRHGLRNKQLLATHELVPCPPQLDTTRSKAVAPLVLLASFDVTDFGAHGNGVASSTHAFRQAMKALAAIAHDGGAQLVVPRGRYVTGPFNLTSHTTLLLEHGAVILGSTDFGEYPLIPQPPTYGPGRSMAGPRYQSLIYGTNITDVIIAGQNGTIDGQGLVWWKAWESNSLSHMRGHLLEVQYSSSIVVYNLTFINSPLWNIRPIYSDHIYLHSLTIVAPIERRETDGIDPDSCQYVVIERCYISVGDDAVAIKSGWDQYGYNLKRESAFIVVRNLELRSAGGLAIGSEMSGGVRDVVFEGCRIYGAGKALFVKSAAGRGGEVQGVVFRDIYVEGVRDAFGIYDYFGHGDPPGFDPTAMPVIKRVFVSNLWGVGVKRYIGLLVGLPESPALGIHLRDISVQVEPGGKWAGREWKCKNVAGTAKNVSGNVCTELLLVP